MKYTIVTCFIIFISLSFAVFLLNPHKKKNNTVLAVGMLNGCVPFIFVNQEGKYEGFDVDVAQEIAQRMKKKLTIHVLDSFASGYLAIDQDKVDVLMSGLDITQKRRHSLNMVYYTGEKAKEYSLIFWDKIPSAITSIEDIQHIPDAIVCVEMGSLKESFVDKYSFIKKKRMNSVVDMILDLCFGKSLAALADSRIARRLKMQNDQLQLLSVPLPPEHQVCGCGIAMNKNNTQCARSVARIVDDMIHDGTLKQLEVKWQLEE